MCCSSRYSILFLLGILSVPVVMASSGTDWLMARYEAVASDADALNRAWQAGRERATLCSYCHGKDGNSLKPEVPNLAGQNPLYLWTQIDHFARGTRKNFVMQALARDFSNEDKLNLAIYFSRNPVRRQKAEPARIAQGESLYQRNCAACHGDSAHGNQRIARLAGQNPAYLIRTLRAFRDNATATSQNGGAVRRSRDMEAVAAGLSDADIRNLAAFLSTRP